MISTNIFWRTVISGFFATFTMTMIAFTQAGLGLPVIDVGHFLTESFNQAHDSNPYNLLMGSTAYYIFGIILALIWVVFLQNRIPGNWFLQGLIYGILISIVAAVLVSPLISLAAGEPFGVFYFQTWTPGLILLSGLIMHIGYGIVLLLCLNYAGVQYSGFTRQNDNT